MKRHSCFLRLGTALFGFTLAAVALARLGGLWWNSTPSYPIGLWRVTSSIWQKGDLVLVDVPGDDALILTACDRGYLRSGPCGGRAPLLKRVVAVEGDNVVVSDRVFVDGREQRNGRLLTVDRAGRPLSQRARSGVVPAGAVWLMSDYTDRSFDSRYFGALPAALVRGRAELLWTW